LQPAPVTNASVYALTPPLVASWARVVPPLDSRPMSTYGATSVVPPPAGGGGAVVTGGAVVGAVVGGRVAGGVVAGGRVVGAVVGVVGAGAPPPHGAPLIVHDVGSPLPVTMKPNSTLPPAGTVPL
jgi:hypothetical protein